MATSSRKDSQHDIAVFDLFEAIFQVTVGNFFSNGILTELR